MFRYEETGTGWICSELPQLMCILRLTVFFIVVQLEECDCSKSYHVTSNVQMTVYPSDAVGLATLSDMPPEKPNTHLRHRRDATVELSPIGGVYGVCN